jgi:parallel beta-helix repeat protein
MSKNVKLTVVLIFLVLIVTGVFCFGPAKAQFQGDITINVDGSVTPSSAPILQSGSRYSLTSNINESIAVNRSNMVLDGSGYTISKATVYILSVSNVTAKNLIIVNSYQGFSIGDSTGVIVANNTVRETGASLPFSETWAISIQHGNLNQIIENNIIDNIVGVSFAETSDNLVVGNNITDCSSIAFGLYNSSYNRFYHNNMANNSLQFKDEGIGLYPYMVSMNAWDNGSISGGNYWSDYELKYPDSSEINQSGIWNTSYAIDRNNVDNYPLTRQVDISAIASTPTPTPIEQTAVPIIPIAGFVAVVVVVVAAGLFVYFKKQKRAAVLPLS